MSDVLSFIEQEQTEIISRPIFKVGQVTFEIGFKVYTKGYSNADTLFAYTNKAEKAGAFKVATALTEELGADPPQASYVLIMPKDNCLFGGDNWNVDQYYIRGRWNEKVVDEDGVKHDDRIVFNSVKPYLGDGSIFPGKPFWGKVRLVPSPWHLRRGEAGRTKTDQNGDKQFPLIAILDTLYDSKVEAVAEASLLREAFGAGEDSDAPPGWDAPSWASSREEIGKAYADAQGKFFKELKGGGMKKGPAKTKAKQQAIAEVCEEWEIDEEWLTKALVE